MLTLPDFAASTSIIGRTIMLYFCRDLNDVTYFVLHSDNNHDSKEIMLVIKTPSLARWVFSLLEYLDI